MFANFKRKHPGPSISSHGGSWNPTAIDQTLGPPAFLVFERLHRFHNTFIILGALMAGLSIATLSFNEFHPTSSAVMRAAEGCLTSSSLTAVVSVMTATMLLFRFEGHTSATRRELATAWSPLVMLNVANVEQMVGTVLWYTGKMNVWRGVVMDVQFVVLIVFASWMAVWMWRTMSQIGGLGAAEVQAVQRKT